MLRSTGFALRTAARQTAVRGAERHSARALATAATAVGGGQRQSTVEELYSQTAAEILAEREGGKSTTMRHFTVNFGYVQPARSPS